jgi:hypothetical protein
MLAERCMEKKRNGMEFNGKKGVSKVRPMREKEQRRIEEIEQWNGTSGWVIGKYWWGSRFCEEEGVAATFRG